MAKAVAVGKEEHPRRAVEKATLQLAGTKEARALETPPMSFAFGAKNEATSGAIAKS